jgi:hypothetical protein
MSINAPDGDWFFPSGFYLKTKFLYVIEPNYLSSLCILWWE